MTMEREEAIKELAVHLVHWKRLKNEHTVPTDECENTINALRMAIEALQAPQAPTDGDSISRQGVINLIRREVFWCDNLIDEIKLLPSTDRPTGEWIHCSETEDFKEHWSCSNCGHDITENPKYTNKITGGDLSFVVCPFCVADMRGKK